MRAAYTSWQSYSPDRVPGLGGALKQRQLKKKKEGTEGRLGRDERQQAQKRAGGEHETRGHIGGDTGGGTPERLTQPHKGNLAPGGSGMMTGREVTGQVPPLRSVLRDFIPRRIERGVIPEEVPDVLS